MVRTLLLITIPILIIVLVLLMAYALFVFRFRRQKREPDRQLQDEQAARGPQTTDIIASAAVEEVEEMVKQQLAAYLAENQISLDFAPASDGGLFILLNGKQYRTADSIPDARIREAIEAAVERYNQGA
jgi:hypothetical protein